MHNPKNEILYYGLNPAGALYEVEQVINSTGIDQQIKEFQKVLSDNGVTVMNVADILASNRDSLEEIFLEFSNQRFDLKTQQKVGRFVTKEYFRQALRGYTSQDLVKILLSRPELILRHDDKNNFLFIEKIEIRPLGNLLFCRDQQITTTKGVIIGNLNSDQRSHEPKIMQHVFKILGVPTHQIPSNCHLEGGDFMCISKEICFLGTGVRTHSCSGLYLMQQKLVESKLFVMVEDIDDRDQQRMHLDTYFNIIDEKNVLMLNFSSVPNKPGSTLARIARVYVMDWLGNYHKVRDQEFTEFLVENGFFIFFEKSNNIT